jgi:hypothetical protein
MSDIPSLLAYPKILHIDEVPEIRNRLVYIIDNYELNGITILLFHNDGQMGMKFGDWDGNELNNADCLNEYPIGKLCQLMHTARIIQAQFYFSKDKLVDIRTHLNRMVGPGMLKDLCGKLIPIQSIIDTQILSDETLAKIDKHVILKHSSFKIIMRGQETIPLYAIAGVKNER